MTTQVPYLRYFEVANEQQAPCRRAGWSQTPWKLQMFRGLHSLTPLLRWPAGRASHLPARKLLLAKQRCRVGDRASNGEPHSVTLTLC